jgi:hypothetical protein
MRRPSVIKTSSLCRIRTISAAGAEFYRRAAGHPTEGGRKTDRLLIAMAERLEREAAEDEEQAATEHAAIDTRP